MSLNKLEYVEVDAAYIDVVYYYTMSGFDCVRSHTRLLAYGTKDPAVEVMAYAAFTGSPENGLSSALSTTTTKIAYEAMFGNACIFLLVFVHKNDKAAFNMTQCEGFGGGVMLQGFTAVIEKWWADGYLESDAQLRGLFTATAEAMYQGRGALGLAEGGVSFFLSLRPHPLIFVGAGGRKPAFPPHHPLSLTHLSH